MKSWNGVFAAAVALAGAGCSSMSPSTTGATSAADVPAAIAVPSGNRLVATLKASGLQNYECRASGGSYAWTFVAPEAALRDTNDALVGRHFGGPTWEHADGSKVIGKVVAETPAPTAGNIPWLLLQGTSTGTGAFAGTTYVQRVATSGGTAPSDACTASAAGQRKGVRYTADYRFFKV